MPSQVVVHLFRQSMIGVLHSTSKKRFRSSASCVQSMMVLLIVTPLHMPAQPQVAASL